MKVLITGGSGFLGQRTATYLKSIGWQVYAPSHSQMDITDPASIRKVFLEYLPDCVIHTAAVSDTGLCQQKPEWSERINVTGTVNLVNICREFDVKPVICSSDQVYFASPIPGPHNETEVLSPGNVYGIQKLRSEQLCLDIFPETVCLRLSWMYARQDIPGQHSHFLATLKGAVQDETKSVTCPIYDRRGLTDVEYVIQNLPAALKLEGGIWNFGSDNDGGTYDTVKAVLEELGMESALQRLIPNEEAFSANPRDISMDLTKLNRAGIDFPNTKEGLRLALKADV